MRTLRLQIEHSHHSRSMQILHQCLPLLCSAMGESLFAQMILMYLDSNYASNDSFQFLNLSKNINRFLRMQGPWKNSPHLSEIARFERMCFEMKAAAKFTGLRGFQVFSSHYQVKKKHTQQVKFRRAKHPHYFALLAGPSLFRIKTISDMEFRILNWISKDNGLDLIVKKCRRFQINEKKFFKIYFKLVKLGFIEQQIVLN